MALSAATAKELQRRDLQRAQRNGQLPQGVKLGVPTLGSVGDVYLEDVPPLRDCRPGILPSEYNVVIAMAEVRNEIAGGILLADETKERLVDACQLGRIIAASPVAFNYDRFPPGQAPKVGDLVWFARFAGGLFTGADGRVYRVIKDKDVMAVIPPNMDPVVELPNAAA